MTKMHNARFRWRLLVVTGAFAGLCLAVGLAVIGCQGLRGSGAPAIWYSAHNEPVFLVKYYAYRPDGTFVTEPIPDYDAWTDERMKRDLQRLSNAGIDGVLVVITPDIFADSFRRGRVLYFVGLAGRMPLGMRVRVGFFLEGRGLDGGTFRRDQIGRWVVASGLRYAPGCLTNDGRPMFVVGPHVKMEGPNHPAASFVFTGTPGSGWHWPDPGAPDRWKLGRLGRQILVRAGDLGGGVPDDPKTWRLPRDRGRTLQKQLWHAFRLRAHTICISSWNNFATGDFIEPNGLDGRMAYDVLALEIARARKPLKNLEVKAMDKTMNQH